MGEVKTKMVSTKRRALRRKNLINPFYKPTPFAIAWNAYTETEEYKKKVEGSGIGLHPSQWQYLENRIFLAFEDGWKAHENSHQNVNK